MLLIVGGRCRSLTAYFSFIQLVIGGSGDVSTPIVWAVEMAEAIGGVFLPSDHQGHTTVFINENDCVDFIVIDFLLEGTLPPEGTSCD